VNTIPNPWSAKTPTFFSFSEFADNVKISRHEPNRVSTFQNIFLFVSDGGTEKARAFACEIIFIANVQIECRTWSQEILKGEVSLYR
jgi:hypothetical protein